MTGVLFPATTVEFLILSNRGQFPHSSDRIVLGAPFPHLSL